MKELKLYKLITESGYLESFRWQETEFYVFVDYIWFDDFIKELIEIFDTDMFSDGGVQATLFDTYLCIDLCDLVENYGVNLEEIFPRSEYEY
jgi:hypothetical protein